MTKIVLFSDGTGNSSAKAEKTNVWRMFQALDQRRSDVRAMYDDGVGTSRNKYLAALGGVFGWGLKRNVIHLYKFACRNHQNDKDEIYGFGFSRGAFTIRVLVGLIVEEGLVTFRSEDELDRNARAAYRHYRSKRFPSWSPIVIIMRLARDAIIALKNFVKGAPSYTRVRAETLKQGRMNIRIKFLGLWDTVEAYGMPVLELKRAIGWLLWPMLFGDMRLSPQVQRACHAVSLDDERTTFHPLLWDQVAEAEMVQAGKVNAGRITQVWFAGVHSNVGGGYPEDQLSLVTLAWMMNQAIDNDLPLDTDCVKLINAQKSAYARIYDSRAGLKSYYRYAPRRIPIEKQGGTDILPIVHGSVILRMVHGSDDYVPVTLPHEFWVLASDGALLPMQGKQKVLQLDAGKSFAAAAPSQIKTADVLRQERRELESVINQLARPDHDVVEMVWDAVWCRRLMYFPLFALTALLVAYPFNTHLVHSAVEGLLVSIPGYGRQLLQQLNINLGNNDGITGGFIAPAVDAAAGFVPSFLASWKEALLRHPIEFTAIVLGIVWCLYVGTMLKGRIADRARLAWKAGRLTDYRQWLLAKRVGGRNFMIVGAAIFSALFAIAIAKGLNFVSVETGTLVAVFFGMGIWRWSQLAQYRRFIVSPAAQHPQWKSMSIGVARPIRTNRALAKLYLAAFKYFVPLLFVAALILAGFYIVNRVVFDARSATGRFCKATVQESSVERLGIKDGFSTSEVCWSSGIVLQEGRRYLITLTTPGDWFDRGTRTDVGGFAANGAKHIFAGPMRRWMGQNYFKPIARIGNIGNEEYVLDPTDKLEDHTYCTDPGRYGKGSSTPMPSEQQTHRESEEAMWRTACSHCEREEIHFVTEVGGWSARTRSKINPTSKDKLLQCSPTPDGRTTLQALITPRATGELFLYVNDAVLSMPGYTNLFYENNTGTGKLEVVRARNLNDGAAGPQILGGLRE